MTSGGIDGDQIRDGTIKNVDIASNAAIAITKLDSAVASTSYVDSVAGLAAGIVQMYAGSSAPSGWLVCDGSAVSRTTYSALFTAIGTTWGVGDGSTTFNLPDMRGRSPLGAGSGTGLTSRTLGTSYGSEKTALNASDIPSHTHPIGGNSGIDNADHTHTVSATTGTESATHTHGPGSGSTFIGGTGGNNAAASGSAATNWSTSTATLTQSANHTHSFSATSSGRSSNHSHSLPTNTGSSATSTTSPAVLHPVATFNFIIKT
jgi:microcystin-dependent protein